MFLCLVTYSYFFFNDTATTEIYTLSLHDALPISLLRHQRINALRQHGLELLDNLAAHARSASSERDDLQCHHQSDDRFGRSWPRPATMRHNQVALEQLRIPARIPLARQLSEPLIAPVL